MPLAERIEASNHDVVKTGSRYMRTICLSQPERHKLHSWLDSPCRPLTMVPKRGTKRAADNLQPAAEQGSPAHGQERSALARGAHASHLMWHKRGVLVCMSCGSFAAGGALRKLLRPCVKLPPDAHHGKLPRVRQVLRRLAAGLPPTANTDWPFPEDGAPATGYL